MRIITRLTQAMPCIDRARDDVRVQRLGAVDVLRFAHLGEGPDLIAIHGRLLVIAGIRGLLHACGECGHHVVLPPLQEQSRVLHVGIVQRWLDAPDARRGTALDLVQQAGPRPVLEDRVFTGTQAEDLLQELDALADRAGIGERTEVAVCCRSSAPRWKPSLGNACPVIMR